ncbi:MULTISPECIES: hypothetical protein [Paenibacillus]|uniref:hypothetical protein n=1 Tax=Paenibacillus TaxID=44249 RepID=UPI0007C653E8|nr:MULTISPECIES: hypothetical protein [Paenibacillus]
MSKKLWAHLDVKAYTNRSEYLRTLVNRDMTTEGQWGNEACLGYAMLAARRLGYSPEQIELLVKSIYHEFDVTSVAEARKEYTSA